MARAESLTAIRLISESVCRFTHDVEFEKINIQELVGVTVEDSYENNQKVYTTTATFQTCGKEPMTERQVAFRLTALDGHRFMIGTNSRPFPIVKEQNYFPEKPTDTSLKKVTVTWKSLFPMLLIIE